MPRYENEQKLMTFKNRRGRSPLLLVCEFELISRTLVRKASLPVRVQANQVPPATSSLPPSISVSSHHDNGFVGLDDNINKRIINTKIHKTICIEEEEDSLPIVVFISVEEEKEGIQRMRFPYEHRYTHAFFFFSPNAWILF